MNILVGDIGGTKTQLVLIQNGKRLDDKKYPSKGYSYFSDIVVQFLAPHSSVKVDYICLGVAGVVEKGRCKATNLPWIVSEEELKTELNVGQVWLINDLVAHGYGISCLADKDIMILNEGEKDAQGNIALLAAGTGLGEAGFYWDGHQHHCFPTQGGHCDFAPRNELEIRLLQYLQKKYKRVSYERVVSGPGIELLFHFFVEEGLENKPSWLEHIKLEELGKTISMKAVNKECPLCIKIIELFLSLYGSEASNFALKLLSRGGVYIGGGLAIALAPLFKEPIFMKGFLNKGRFEELLLQFPVKVILNHDTAILGAVEYISAQLKNK